MTQQHIVVATLTLALVGAAAAACAKQEPPQNIVPLATYFSPDVGLEFAYRGGPDGYVLQEAQPGTADSSLVHTIDVVPTDAADQPARAGGEGPAQISVRIYTNPDNQWSGQWAESHPSSSGINLKQGDVTEAVVGGANAVRFPTDGLYAADVVVVAHGGLVYVFRGEFIDAGSRLRQDFRPLIESVRFIPLPGSAADSTTIDEICEGALAYMTFPDGAAADRFVAECKEGKHPDVIARHRGGTQG